MTLILGVSDLDRSPAAALFDGAAGPLAASEEVKLVRTDPHIRIPRHAIEYCLREAGADLRDVSAVAVAGRPNRARLRERKFRVDLLGSRRADRQDSSTSSRAVRRLAHAQLLRRVLGSHVPLYAFEHHLCHAASAFYPSDFDRALVLTLDGSGDMWSGLLAVGEGPDLKIIRPLRFPNSLGWLYAQITELLGFRPGRDEHKTQWLSTAGSPDRLPVFRKLFSNDGHHLPLLNRRCLGQEIAEDWRLASDVVRQLCPAGAPDVDRAYPAVVARSLQQFLEDTVVDLAEQYRLATGTRHLCLAGGVFLNVLLVRALERRTGFEQVFVQPVADNAGTALGAGYLARRRLEGDPHRSRLETLELGPAFDDHAIKRVLDNCKLIYRYYPGEEPLLAETATLLHQNKIVAWFQGRMEFGHRALGNRSILASPFSPFVKENLNAYIKHRQDFHPFVLSVPLEASSRLFDATENCRYVASVADLRPGLTELRQFAFGNEQVRLHLVEPGSSGRFARLLDKFGEQAPVPVLVNTSFNLFGEPLVCDPREAVRSFYCSGIDALVIGNFVVVK